MRRPGGFQREEARQTGLFGRNQPLRAQFAPCLPYHQRRALKREDGHDGCNDEVGHPAPVPNTPAAASSTARLPTTSFRVQIQAERILASPSRNAQSSPNDAALATSAVMPTAPIAKALGSVP